MKKKLFVFAVLTACMGLLLSGCKKEKEVEGQAEDTLIAISLNDLEPGHFYVKFGDSFYLLPVEDCNFDPSKPVWSTDSRETGMTSLLENRLLGFVHRDMAIPTLYKNGQLVYVSDGSISAFTWERFRDCGYSIGFSGLVLSESGKIKSDPQTACCEGSSLKATLEALGLGKDTDVTVDAINWTALSPQYLNSAGIITGMSKDAAANVDLYLGTQHTPISICADTKYYQSFELYKTAKYALSTDGYAIVEVPAYFRSGYYLINNMGFVKFLNVDRGIDESGIDLNSAYYYEGKDGKTLTFYEWQEQNGIQEAQGQSPAQTQPVPDAEDYEEQYAIFVDNTQKFMSVTVANSNFPWVSRAKFPNLWRAEERAKRYEFKSRRADQRRKMLQKPIEDMHGDNAFFTRPEGNSNAGRAFANKRKRMIAAWDRGLEEFRKTEYYAERAETARRTAKGTKPTDKAFLVRRIKEAETIIKAQRKNLETYQEKLDKIEQGKVFKSYSGEIITAETVQRWIENAELMIENAISKFIYYYKCLETVGEVEYSQENIKVGYTVELTPWGKCKVIGTGRVNLTYRILEGGAAGMSGKAAYSEIKRIISDQIQIDPHPFHAGEVYMVKAWNGQAYADKEYRVTKITEQKVTLKSENERAITRKPRKFRNSSSPNGYIWAMDIVDGRDGTIYKNDEGTI